MPLTVSTPDTNGDISAFDQVANRIYAGDPFYLPTPQSAIMASLRRREFSERQRLFVVSDGEGPCARAVARVSSTLKDENGKALGMIGFFEAIEDPGVICKVLGDALDWLSSFPVSTVVGPMDGDTWHRYRFMTGPFDERPFLMEPYNKAWYGPGWEACGFRILETYSSRRILPGRLDAAEQALRPHRNRAEKRFTFRRIDMSRFEEELRTIYDITVETFKDNFLYTDIGFEEFLSLYDGVESLLDPDFVWFAETTGGEPVGFVFSLPDYFDAVYAMKGRRNLVSKLRFLMNKKKADTINIKTLGVRPAWQRSGAAVAMMQIMYEQALAKGYQRCNLCLIREGNPSGRMDGGEGEVMRQYSLYSRTLS